MGEATKSVMIPEEQEMQPLRGGRQKDLRDIPHRWFEVLAMHLAGRSAAEIGDVTGYSLPTVWKILRDPVMTDLRRQQLELYEMEFEQLYPTFIRTVHDLMRDPDAKAQASGAALFSKHFGTMQKRNDPSGDPDNAQQGPLSAEKVVYNIINQLKVDVHNG